tara:strand:- start:1444 stop:1575 length:132 start_codon:yes stop_codon:yes gene_type:complete
MLCDGAGRRFASFLLWRVELHEADVNTSFLIGREVAILVGFHV